MDIVYLDIDSLRPDHIGAYGYPAPTTPRIDELADDAARFDTMYAANSPCIPSRAAVLSGRYGIHNGVETHGVPGRTMSDPSMWRDFDGDPADYWTLPETFFHARTPTVAVSSFPRHPAPWFYQLWHEFHQPQEPPGTEEYFQTPRAADVTDKAIDLLDRHDDLFLYVQYWDPHAPYNRSDAEIEPFTDPPTPEHPTPDQMAARQDWDAWRSAAHMDIHDTEDLERLLAGYDAEIRYMDEHVGRLLTALQEQDRYDDALIVLTADHGEEFGEHGLYREHWSTYDGTQHIPLIVKPPHHDTATARDQLATTVDLPPTILDYADLDVPAAWHGSSLRPVIEQDTDIQDHIVFDHGLYTAQRAVRTDKWKLITTYHPGMWGGKIPGQQLFNMDTDPWEQTNLAETHPDIVDDLAAHADRFADRYVTEAGDPLQRVAEQGPEGVTGHITDVEEWGGV